MALDWNNLTDEQFLLIYGYPRTPRLDHPAFMPTYERHFVSWQGNDGTSRTAPIDEKLTPTKETAEVIARIYAVGGVPLRVIESSFLGPGAATSDAIERFVQWPNRAILPVSQLATYYTQNPEAQFPTVADKLCRLLIARIWQQG